VLTPAGADAAIAAGLAPLPIERRRCADAAGAVLREDVHAERDHPPFDRVAMDGIAIASAAWRAGRREFRIAGTQAAGAPPLHLADPDTACLEAMTGAVLPAGTDAVLPVEQFETVGDLARAKPGAVLEAGQHVHRRASDARAGDRVLAAGTRLRGPEIAIVASAGRAAVEVSRSPSVVVISTGDELVEPGAPLADWQVRRSNAHGVAAALRLRGHASVADDHVRDDPAELRERLEGHLARHDVVLLSGGVSAGKFDHVPAVFERLGVRQVFHQVAQRPGKPLWFGVAPGGRAVFGLPGNPVSTLVCLVRYVLPALARLAGTAPPPPIALPLAGPCSAPAGLTLFLPVDLVTAPDGGTEAMPHPTRGSGDFGALAGTAGFVELAPGRAWQRGEAVNFHAW
jgi:molybdopterin molybdotransferase